MSGRSVLAQRLRAALPGWQIVSDARKLDGVTKPGACVLWTATRARLPLNRLSYVQDTVALWVLTAADKPEAIEDDLDQLFETVLDVIEGQPEFTWTEATRGTLAGQFEGWHFSITCAARITETN